MEQAYQAGSDGVEAFQQLESRLLEKGLTARRGSTAYQHGQMVTKSRSRSSHNKKLMTAIRNIGTLKHLQQK